METGTIPSADAFADTARGGQGNDGTELLRGDLVARYVILAFLGKGGMGVVYSAFDPDLNRKVAIKMLLPGRRVGDADGHSRLLREAQAMAKLSHPNVVVVHDVGVRGTVVWLAMEFVDGRPLSRWLRDRPRPWEEVLPVFLAAAAGLRAAHAVGLVHRDFKPDNVMIDGEGRVRVMDFGLVRATEGAVEQTAPPGFHDKRGPLLEASLTRTGAVMGTPRYMASEQWNGADTDARTDQFAFCVSMWEALFGVPPFTGANWVELADAVTRGALTPWPRGSRVPAWLREILTRGLRPNPVERFSGMEALCLEIERRRPKPWIRRTLFGGLALGVAAAGFVGWRAYAFAEQVHACELAGGSIDEMWNVDTRNELMRRLERADNPNRGWQYDSIERKVTNWTNEWARLRTQVCLQSTIENKWEPASYDRSSMCFDQQRDKLSVAIELIREQAEVSTARTPLLVSDLPDLDLCTDPDELEHFIVPSPSLADKMHTFRKDVARTRYYLAAGMLLDAKRSVASTEKRMDEFKDTLEPEDSERLLNEMRILESRFFAIVGDDEPAEGNLSAAYFSAITQGQYDVAAQAASEMFTLITRSSLARPEYIALWSLIADTARIRAGGGERSLLAARWHGSYGRYRAFVGDEQGAQYSQEGLDLLKGHVGTEHLLVADALDDIGSIAVESGDHELARKMFAESLHIREVLFGGMHYSMAIAMNGLGSLSALEGRHDQALGYLSGAAMATISVQADYAERNPNMAVVTNNVGIALWLHGQPEEAIKHLSDALSIREAVAREKRGAAGDARIQLALKLGEPQKAVLLRGADRGSLSRELGPQRHLAEARLSLARVLWDAPADRGRDRARASHLAQATVALLSRLDERASSGMMEAQSMLVRPAGVDAIDAQ